MRHATFILLCCVHLACLAQIPSEIKTFYTRKEGLSNNSISAIVKDARGFLWIGTSEGLNRFDGMHFTSFVSDPNNPATIGGNNIYDILQYKPGHLLIATNNGLSILNTLTNTFENDIITTPAVRRGAGEYVRSLFKDRSGKIYMNHSGEIDVFDGSLRFLYRLTDLEWARPLKGIVVSFEQWVEDSHGRIWIPSDNLGVCMLDPATKQLRWVHQNPDHANYMRVGPVRGFYYDEQRQRVYVSFLGHGLEMYDMVTGKSLVQYFNIAPVSEARTINAITMRNGRLICCGGQSVYSVDPETLEYEDMYTNASGSPYINSICLLNDKENLWVGTETRGLLQIAFRTSFVQQIPLPYKVEDYTGFCKGITRSADNKLYFAYGDEGIVEFDQQQGKAQRYKIMDSSNKPVFVTRICADSGRRVLVGTRQGIYLFDNATKKFSRAGWLPAFTDKLNISYLLRDRKGNVWTALNSPAGLGYYEQATGVYHHFPGYEVNGRQVMDPKYIITRMTEDNLGNIWMTSYQTYGKMICYSPLPDRWSAYPSGDSASKAFAGRELNAICVADSVIWAGNFYGLGLMRYDYGKDSLSRIGIKEGLMSENVFAISSDEKKNLFISTTSGVNYLNTSTHEMRALIVDDGDIDWGFAYIQYYDSINRQLVYGLNDRIVIAKGGLWETPPADSLETYIDGITVNNELLAFDNNMVSLTHLQRNISIHFTSINYNRNVALQYAYRLVGIDKEWNFSQQIPTPNYSNLPPGQYTFLVKTKGQSGRWGPVNDSLQIVVVPAVWQRAWFWILAGCIIVSVLVWIVRRRINNIRKSAQLKHKLAETEMMALRAQMNPHFIFNCLSAIDNLMQTNQPDKATTYLTRFARLIRSLLEHSKHNVVPFHRDLETLQLYLQLEQFRAGNKFSYTLDVDQQLVDGDYKVPPLIIQPFVENAIQHGLLNKASGDRKLMVKAGIGADGYIWYTVEDNGVGRERALEIKQLNRPEHRSYGIQITTERLQLHNGGDLPADCVITDLVINGEAAGTRVTIKVKTD